LELVRHDVHVCLISDQATPNFVPVLDSRFRPREVILVVSPQMRAKAACLQRALQTRVERVSEQVLEDAWDIASIQNALLDLLASRSGQRIALNVTGGTKPMAIAAQEVFRAEGLPIFYVHPGKNQVIPLFTDQPPFSIQERVVLSEFLTIHGFSELGRSALAVPDAHLQVAREFVEEVELFAPRLGLLNSLAMRAQDSLQVMLGKDGRDARFSEMLERLERHGILQVAGDVINFPNERARHFANGAWLEDYIFSTAQDIVQAHGIQDVASNLRVESAAGARNEIDIALLAQNRLFLIECKTRKMSGDDLAGPGAESLYKLDSLTSLGGLNTRAMLASYRPLTRWDQQRARDLRIKVVECGQLRNLRRHLGDWLTSE
jgi:hypothetical protein